MFIGDDRKYVEEAVCSGLFDSEDTVNKFKKKLRYHLTMKLQNKRDICTLLFEKGTEKRLILVMIREFLTKYGLEETRACLDNECDIDDNDMVESFDEMLNKLNKISNSFVDNDMDLYPTIIERLVNYSIRLHNDHQTDHITSAALVEASECITSLEEEIQRLHKAYSEQVNETRLIMEKKVSEIERLYWSSVKTMEERMIENTDVK
ncbi:hypothetical protein ACR3K2_24380 [Cryptosporidium serpentis]